MLFWVIEVYGNLWTARKLIHKEIWFDLCKINLAESNHSSHLMKSGYRFVIAHKTWHHSWQMKKKIYEAPSNTDNWKGKQEFHNFVYFYSLGRCCYPWQWHY